MGHYWGMLLNINTINLYNAYRHINYPGSMGNPGFHRFKAYPFVFFRIWIIPTE